MIAFMDVEGWQAAVDAFEQEMVDGYLDGFNLDSPAPSDNRSLSYRHGFLNGRADKTKQLRPYTVDELRHMAACAIAIDAGIACPALKGVPQ